jgi:malonate transporter and related proteins
LKSNSSIPAFRLLTSHLARVPIVVMLGFQYHVVQVEAASAVFFSMMGSLITMGFSL